MIVANILTLQNGSDIRGVAIQTADFEANLTAVEARKIAIGLVRWLENEKNLKQVSQAGKLKVAIGHDSRLSAEELKAALVQGLVSENVQVIDVGLATTPAMFMATKFSEYDCDAGIMITASHLPYYYNGIKIFTKAGGAEHEDIESILAQVDQSSTDRPQGNVEKKEIISVYAADLVSKIRAGIEQDTLKPLTGFKIIVDAGNGAGGFFAARVLEELGADTTGSQFLEPDGHFPNHIPNPDNPEAMASIQAAVLATGADLGVIFDTDVDRAAVVDQDGSVLNRNNLIAVLATIVLGEYPGTTIVTNSPTSSHLKRFINQLGGQQVRYLCGYRNVINKAIQLNEAGTQTELAIETSGHAAFKENYFLDDGAYVIAKILMLLPKLKKSGKNLSDLISTLEQPLEAQEVRFKISGENYRQYGESVIKDLHSFVTTTPGFENDQDTEEGIRVNFSNEYGAGWFLLRMSLHEPLLVLQVENDVSGKNLFVFKQLTKFFSEYDRLDLTSLKQVVASI